ncbi:MAG: hypothetical protein SF029_20540 [bacterium]|nr:hypothetical protein [bacterium]
MAAQPEIHVKQTAAEFEAFIALPENTDRHFELIDGQISSKSLCPRRNMVGR